jgi:hypothetical protein
MGSWSLGRQEEVRGGRVGRVAIGVELWNCGTATMQTDGLVYLGMLHVYEPVF